MCGIGGFVDYERDARRFTPVAQRMKRTLTRRANTAIWMRCSSTAA